MSARPLSSLKRSIALHLVLTPLALIWLFPLWMMAIFSTMPDNGIFSPGIELLPHDNFLANFHNLQRDTDFVGAVVEDRPPHRRRARSQQRPEQSPALQLEYAAAHQRVRRQRVAAVPGPVNAEHSQPFAGEQHRGGRSGHPSADDDDIPAGHDDLPSVRDPLRPPSGWSRRSPHRCR